MEILKDKKVKAKKEHACFFCGGKIKKGETYHYQVNTSDGLVAIKMHTKCQEIALKLDMYDHCDEGLNDELFWEEIIEAYQAIKNIDFSEPLPDVSDKKMLKTVIDHYLK
jgi:ribosomal protein L24E